MKLMIIHLHCFFYIMSFLESGSLLAVRVRFTNRGLKMFPNAGVTSLAASDLVSAVGLNAVACDASMGAGSIISRILLGAKQHTQCRLLIGCYLQIRCVLRDAKNTIY